MTTGRRAKKTKRDFRCPICRSFIGQGSCLICAPRSPLTFPHCFYTSHYKWDSPFLSFKEKNAVFLLLISAYQDHFRQFANFTGLCGTCKFAVDARTDICCRCCFSGWRQCMSMCAPKIMRKVCTADHEDCVISCQDAPHSCQFQTFNKDAKNRAVTTLEFYDLTTKELKYKKGVSL